MTSPLDLPVVPALTEQHTARRPTSPDALIAGPCALPVAPMAMPPQQIEPDLRLTTRLTRLMSRRLIGGSV